MREPIHVPMNPTLKGQAEVLEHIQYSANGQELTLILPWAVHDNRREQEKHPLIVFVQGSAWRTPNKGYEIPMLSHYAEKGLAVASVGHRSTEEGHPFPAFLQDVKCAIRFLRAHADEYALDTSRIAAFGTSSGGHTVCMLGVTGNDEQYRTEEYPDESDAVDLVVACFPPTDFHAMFVPMMQNPNAGPFLHAILGDRADRWEEEFTRYSPARLVEKGKEYPPFMLLHGTGDPVVPWQQTEIMAKALDEAGVPVRVVYVDGAEHEGNFWSGQVRSLIEEEILGCLRP